MENKSIFKNSLQYVKNNPSYKVHIYELFWQQTQMSPNFNGIHLQLTFTFAIAVRKEERRREEV